MMHSKVFFLWLSVATTLSACVTTNEEPPAPPTITEETSSKEAIDAAIVHGGQVLDQTKKLLAQRKELPKTSQQMEAFLIKATGSKPEAEILNAMHLYLAGTRQASIKLFETLVQSNRDMDRILGWNLAANLPSREVAEAMDREFTRRVSRNEETSLMYPQVALAIQANRLTSAYTILRYGLMENGDDSFAKAMITISPSRAADDFLPYLAKASIEELRQINQTSVNVFTCMVILRFYASSPAPISHSDISQLFLYSVSRNQSLSELAALAIERLMPDNRQFLALRLAQLPPWVQVAFVENSKRSKTPGMRQFLTALKEVTSHEEVSQEINDK